MNTFTQLKTSVNMGKDSLVWMIDYANNYQFDREGNCFNIKTGKQLKRVLQNYQKDIAYKASLNH